MRRGRYVVSDQWTTVDTKQTETWSGTVITSTVEITSVTDTRGGYVYERGARRVTIKVRGGGKRTRVFIGERAYDEAYRWERDTINELQRQ